MTCAPGGKRAGRGRAGVDDCWGLGKPSWQNDDVLGLLGWRVMRLSSCVEAEACTGRRECGTSENFQYFDPGHPSGLGVWAFSWKGGWDRKEVNRNACLHCCEQTMVSYAGIWRGGVVIRFPLLSCHPEVVWRSEGMRDVAQESSSEGER